MQPSLDSQSSASLASEIPPGILKEDAKPQFPVWLQKVPYHQHLANTWIAGVVGGILAVLAFCLATFLTPAKINLPLVGDTSAYSLLLFFAIPLVVLAVVLSELRFSGKATYLTVAIPSVIAYWILCSLAQAIALPHLPLMPYNNQPYNLSGASIFIGTIPVLLIAILASRRNWLWFGIFGVVAAFSTTYVPIAILGAIVYVLWRTQGFGLWRRAPTSPMSSDDIREAMRRNGRN